MESKNPTKKKGLGSKSLFAPGNCNGGTLNGGTKHRQEEDPFPLLCLGGERTKQFNLLKYPKKNGTKKCKRGRGKSPKGPSSHGDHQLEFLNHQ